MILTYASYGNKDSFIRVWYFGVAYCHIMHGHYHLCNPNNYKTTYETLEGYYNIYHSKRGSFLNIDDETIDCLNIPLEMIFSDIL